MGQLTATGNGTKSTIPAGGTRPTDIEKHGATSAVPHRLPHEASAGHPREAETMGREKSSSLNLVYWPFGLSAASESNWLA